MLNSHPKGTYDHIKCGSCGVCLEDHNDSCFRHFYLDQAIYDRKMQLHEEKMRILANGHSERKPLPIP